jgi:hypothetical protein
VGRGAELPAIDNSITGWLVLCVLVLAVFAIAALFDPV